MIHLQPMTESDFPSFLKISTEGYAQENIDSGRWPEDQALELAREEAMRDLPQGIDTPDNYFFNIVSDSQEKPVGHLWAAITEKHNQKSLFVYEIEIWEEYRRQGFAAAAFTALEAFTRDIGLDRIGLHVFGANTGAQALYKSLDFEVTGINMMKRLGEQP